MQCKLPWGATSVHADGNDRKGSSLADPTQDLLTLGGTQPRALIILFFEFW